MTDRDPYLKAGLAWLPVRVALPVSARISITAVGDRPTGQVAVRWGHPDFHNNEYFPVWTVHRGETSERTIGLPDATSELEIQTEGGTGTGYEILIWVDQGAGPPISPSVVLRHRTSGVLDYHAVANSVSAIRSSALNQYGEQNVRIDTQTAAPGIIH